MALISNQVQLYKLVNKLYYFFLIYQQNNNQKKKLFQMHTMHVPEIQLHLETFLKFSKNLQKLPMIHDDKNFSIKIGSMTRCRWSITLVKILFEEICKLVILQK